MNRFRRVLLTGAALALVAAVNPVYADDNSYDAKVLVADIPPAPHIDKHLVNPWGVAFNPNGFVWVADNGTGFSTLYDGFGNPSPAANPLIVQIPAAPGNTEHGLPTGIVFNGGGGFAVTSAGKTGNSAFIFVTEDGLIAGWAPSVDMTHAIQAYPKAGDPPSGAVYKGLAIATSAVGNTIYAADFVGGKIDVFNSTFTKIDLAGNFTDPDLQKDFSPFNVQNINGHLFVTYAVREEGEDDETAGPSRGIVNEFDVNGNFVRRFVTRGRLNAPWGVALAPATFGAFANALLIGNFGDGAINAYDAATGEFKGRLRGTDHRELRLDGLWGMAFGNDLNSQPKSTLFFAAGPDDETHGVYGAITPAP